MMLMSELAEIHDLQRQQYPHSPQAEELLHVTTDGRHMNKCAHMLVYLTAETWSTEAETSEFVREVARARELGIHLLIVHELPGLDLPGPTDDRQCGAEAFETLRSQAPQELVHAGIFAQIVVPLKPEPYRHTSMVLLMQAITDGHGDLEDRRPSNEGTLSPASAAASNGLSQPRRDPVPMWLLDPAHKSTQRLLVATTETRAADLRKAAREFYKTAKPDERPPSPPKLEFQTFEAGTAPPPLPPSLV